MGDWRGGRAPAFCELLAVGAESSTQARILAKRQHCCGSLFREIPRSGSLALVLDFSSGFPVVLTLPSTGNAPLPCFSFLSLAREARKCFERSIHRSYV